MKSITTKIVMSIHLSINWLNKILVQGKTLFNNIMMSLLILFTNSVLFYYLDEANINKSVENSELLFTMSKFENNVSINTDCPRSNNTVVNVLHIISRI